MRLNRDATISLAKAAMKNGVSKFITLSSCSVYENSKIDLLTEEEVLFPESPYAVSKYKATQDLSQLFSGSQSKLYVLRPNLIYGKKWKR